MIGSTPLSAYSDQAIAAPATAMRSEPSRPVTSTVAMTGADQDAVQDRVTLSPDGQARARKAAGQDRAGEQNDAAVQDTPEDKASAPGQLSPEEEQTVQKLKKRDAEVKRHEAAHLAAAGQYAAGGPSYTYQNGPDGKRYAIGGEVPIDVSSEKTPEQTVQKMRVVRQAALAPANPSGADHAIAATASMKEAEARRELNSEQSDQNSDSGAVAPDSQSGRRPGQADTIDQAAMQGRTTRRTPLSTYA